MLRTICHGAIALLAVFCAASAQAQEERSSSHCIALVENTPGLEVIHRASFREDVPEFSVRISYIDHAMFLIQGPMTSVITDYNGFTGPEDFVPDVVTMNHAHSTHWTTTPDKRIEHVLQGWGTGGGPIDHHLSLPDMLVRNVSTDIRSGFGGAEEGGNSIFIFEVEGLCVGHLGHLHHEPTDEQYAAIGRLDVVMAAVDGGMTLPTEIMIDVLKRIRASVVIPMHWWSGGSLSYFLSEMSEEFAVEMSDARSFEVSLRTLPQTPTVLVLRPRFLGFNDSGE